MQINVVQTAKSTAMSAVEMLASHGRPWSTKVLRHNTRISQQPFLHDLRKGGEDARKTACKALQTKQLSQAR